MYENRRQTIRETKLMQESQKQLIEKLEKLKAFELSERAKAENQNFQKSSETEIPENTDRVMEKEHISTVDGPRVIYVQERVKNSFTFFISAITGNYREIHYNELVINEISRYLIEIPG